MSSAKQGTPFFFEKLPNVLESQEDGVSLVADHALPLEQLGHAEHWREKCRSCFPSLNGAKCQSVTSACSASSLSDLTKAPAQLSALNCG